MYDDGRNFISNGLSADRKTGDVIGKQPVKVENGIMTTEVLMAFGRVSGPVVSPDKSKILYGVSYENLEQNKSNRELFVMDIDGQNKSKSPVLPNRKVMPYGSTEANK